MFDQIKRFLSISAAGFALILLGAGCNPFAQSPEENLSQMRQNMAEVKSMNYDAKMTLSGFDKPSGNSLGMILGGSQDVPEKIDLAISGQTAVNNYSSPDSKMNISLGIPGKESKIKLNARTVKNKTYLRLNSLGPLQTSPIAAMVGSSFVGQWIELPKSDKSAKVETDNKELTEEQKQEIKKLTKETNFFKVTKDLGTEEVNGKEAYHYQTQINTRELKSFINETKKITETKTKQEEQEKLNKQIRQLKDKNIDIWIGTDDKLLYKISASDIKMEQENNSKTTADLTAIFSNYNQDITVKKPESAKSMEDLFGGMLGGQNGAGLNLKGQGGINMEGNKKKKLPKNMDMNGMNLEKMKQLQQ